MARRERTAGRGRSASQRKAAGASGGWAGAEDGGEVVALLWRAASAGAKKSVGGDVTGPQPAGGASKVVPPRGAASQ